MDVPATSSRRVYGRLHFAPRWSRITKLSKFLSYYSGTLTCHQVLLLGWLALGGARRGTGSRTRDAAIAKLDADSEVKSLGCMATEPLSFES